MAWHDPFDWATGALVSADRLNEQVRDNMTVLKLAVDDSGKIIALNSTYLADTSGVNLTGVVRLAFDNDFTDGVQNFNGGAGTRLVIPVGADKWATV